MSPVQNMLGEAFILVIAEMGLENSKTLAA